VEVADAEVEVAAGLTLVVVVIVEVTVGSRHPPNQPLLVHVVLEDEDEEVDPVG
jgi:hypothetical protein